MTLTELSSLCNPFSKRAAASQDLTTMVPQSVLYQKNLTKVVVHQLEKSGSKVAQKRTAQNAHRHIDAGGMLCMHQARLPIGSGYYCSCESLFARLTC